ncbi:MAG: hypothetical protein EOO50_16620 [Flavobacterium sp.]|uniref:DUF6265 family protein n=1 Tax=Flavobacterium sp. TaxID=239 RepID=UPI00120BB9A7|nr:DUF6265 family protein [Flavobacterium sp.]RZJ64160.1 MAG: hypothetical protein EOO50_16620 [Flavobacterium sp.]
MKKLLLLVILAAGFSCKKSADESQANTKPSFDYLLGDWARSNDEPGQSTFESWRKKNDSVYSGIGFTLKDKDTIWLENVEIANDGRHWNFSVTPKGSIKVTPFQLTDIEPDGFTCKNDKNEFPKRIKYKVTHDKIHAVISGAGNPDVAFEFDRIR